jgi:hypothetical protein
MTLKTARQGRTREGRDGFLQGIAAVSEWQQRVCWRKAMARASCSAVSTVEASFGPIGASAVMARLRYLATVLGLMLWRLANVWRLS